MTALVATATSTTAWMKTGKEIATEKLRFYRQTNCAKNKSK